MERESGTPQPAEADAALSAARRTEQATRYPDVPWWFLMVNAVLMTLMALTPLAGDRFGEYLSLCAIAIIALNLVASRLSGRIGAQSTTKAYTAMMVTVFVLIFVGVGVYEWKGWAEVVYVVAALVFVLMVGAGASYRKIAQDPDGVA